MKGLLPCGACVAAVAAALLACQLDTGVSVQQIRLQAVLEADGTPARELPETACFRPPVLLGARREQVYTIADAMSLELSGTRDEVQLTVRGASASQAPRSIRSEDWSQGVEFQATTANRGETYRITLSGGCLKPNAAEASQPSRQPEASTAAEAGAD